MKERINGEIKEVSGSSNEGESSNVEYLDLSEFSGEERGRISLYFAMFARGIHDDGAGNINLLVCSIAAFPNSRGYDVWGQEISAIAIDVSAELILGGKKMSFSEVFPLVSGGIDLVSIPRLTKEQFYSLD